MKKETVGKKILIDVLCDTVSIKIVCGSDYEAQVLFDDLIERINSGEGFELTIDKKPK